MRWTFLTILLMLSPAHGADEATTAAAYAQQLVDEAQWAAVPVTDQSGAGTLTERLRVRHGWIYTRTWPAGPGQQARTVAVFVPHDLIITADNEL